MLLLFGVLALTFGVINTILRFWNPFNKEKLDRHKTASMISAICGYVVGVTLLFFNFNKPKESSPPSKSDTIPMLVGVRIHDTVRISTKEEKPDLDILPLRASLNPIVKKDSAGALDFYFGYGNNGNGKAVDIHAMYDILVLRNGRFWLETKFIKSSSYPGEEFHDIKDLIMQDQFSYKNTTIVPTDTFFVCAIFCYKNESEDWDTLKRRMFSWQYGNILKSSRAVSIEQYDSIKTILQADNRWPVKYYYLPQTK